MDIREASIDDNDALIELQGKCPVGTTMIVSILNTPDFFARAKAYEDYKVYVICEGKRIIASGACALRDAVVNGRTEKVGYQFQLFVDPEYRGRRLGGQLHFVREEYLKKRGAVLSYALIIEGNTPSMRHVGRLGVKRQRQLVMSSISVYKEMEVAAGGKVRSMLTEDLRGVAALLNEAWQGYELYEPMTADAFERLVARTPAYSYDNIFVLEDDGQIVACLGFWDWSQVMNITVRAITRKMRATGFILDVLRLFRPLPRGLRPSDTLKQVALIPIGYKDPEHLAALLRHVNNQAFLRGIEQIFLICDREHPLLGSLRDFVHIDSTVYLYTKPLQPGVSIADKLVFISGLDL